MTLYFFFSDWFPLVFLILIPIKYYPLIDDFDSKKSVRVEEALELIQYHSVTIYELR